MKGKMLYRVLAAASMLMALVPALAATPTPAGAEVGTGTVYLALGDSLGAGEGASVHDRYGYVPRFYTFLRTGVVGDVDSFTNLSEGGATSGSLLYGWQLDEALEIIANPDTTIGVVTLDIGGNDLLDLLKGGPCVDDPEGDACRALAYQAMLTFMTNFGQILGTLQGALGYEGSPPLLVMTYYNPWSGADPTMEYVVNGMLLGAGPQVECSDPMLMGLNDIITCMGQAYGATVVNTYPRFIGKGLELTHIAENDIHPNDDGHAQIAVAFKQAFLPR